MRALHAQRLERAKAKGCKDVDILVVPDDDGTDLEALENKSLEQAKKGIVVEGIIVIDGDETVEFTGGKSTVGEKETTVANGVSLNDVSKTTGGKSTVGERRPQLQMG